MAPRSSALLAAVASFSLLSGPSGCTAQPPSPSYAPTLGHCPSSVPPTAASVPSSAKPIPQFVARYQQVIPYLMEREQIAGLSVAVVTREGPVWTEGFGVRAQGTPDPVSSDTIFSIQSISKVITATAVMTAVQDGLLDLDVPITRYLPEFKLQSTFEEHPEQRITLRHLLSHKAGLPHEAPIGNNYDPESESFEAHIRSIERTWLRFPVGRQYSYSNLGIDLAGYALQRISGKPFASLVKTRLLEPLGMSRSSFDMQTIRNDANRAVGHDRDLPKVPLEVPMIPSGGFYSSANDMARFVQFHLNHGSALGRQVLKPGILQQMSTIPFLINGQTEGYALGIDVRRDEGLYFNHNGSGFGFRADMYWWPNDGLGVVVLTNSENHELQTVLSRQIIDDAAKELLPSHSLSRDTEPVKEPSGKEQPASPQGLLGVYVFRGQKFRVHAAKEGLLLTIRGTEYPLHFYSPSEAFIRKGDRLLRYRFTTDHGAAQRLISIQDGIVAEYNDGPNDKPGPNRKDWKSFAGTYQVLSSVGPADKHSVAVRNGYLYFDDLRLREMRPSLFFTCDGEALDLRDTKNLRWRNLRLSRLP